MADLVKQVSAWSGGGGNDKLFLLYQLQHRELEAKVVQVKNVLDLGPFLFWQEGKVQWEEIIWFATCVLQNNAGGNEQYSS